MYINFLLGYDYLIHYLRNYLQLFDMSIIILFFEMLITLNCILIWIDVFYIIYIYIYIHLYITDEHIYNVVYNVNYLFVYYMITYDYMINSLLAKSFTVYLSYYEYNYIILKY